MNPAFPDLGDVDDSKSDDAGLHRQIWPATATLGNKGSIEACFPDDPVNEGGELESYLHSWRAANREDAPTIGTEDAAEARERMGQILVDQGKITPEQLEWALEQQRSTGALLGEILVSGGLIDRLAIASVLARQWDAGSVARSGADTSAAVAHGTAKPSLPDLASEQLAALQAQIERLERTIDALAKRLPRDDESPAPSSGAQAEVDTPVEATGSPEAPETAAAAAWIDTPQETLPQDDESPAPSSGGQAEADTPEEPSGSPEAPATAAAAWIDALHERLPRDDESPAQTIDGQTEANTPEEPSGSPEAPETAAPAAWIDTLHETLPRADESPESPAPSSGGQPEANTPVEANGSPEAPQAAAPAAWSTVSPQARNELTGELPRPLGELLVATGYLSNEQLAEALAEVRATGNRLGGVLLRRGWLFEAELARMLSRQWAIPYVDIASVGVDRATARLLPHEIGLAFAAIPVRLLPDGGVQVAFGDPTDDQALYTIRGHIPSALPAVAALTDIDSAWRAIVPIGR